MVLLVAAAIAGDATQGAVLAGLASCEACHTSDGGAPFAGGHAIETPFGTFYGSNLTPDGETGVGEWTFEDFSRAMRKGRSPDGHGYWPAFPYPSFTAMEQGDLEDLWAYLQSVEPVESVVPPHDGPASWKRGAWRLLNFSPRAFRPDPDADAFSERGRYLVEAVGHCGECHSPRGALGKVKRSHALEGGSKPYTVAPAIDPESLTDWSDDDLDTFFTMGMLPDGDFTGGGMGSIISKGTSKLSDADRAALITFLKQPR